VAWEASFFPADGRTMAAGVAAVPLCEIPVTAAVVFLPSEKPMEKKMAQTSTKAKKMASMRPVPSVISVSCCAVGILSSVDLYFPAAAGGVDAVASNFCIPEKKSIGTGNTTVVFFSTPISVSVCR